MRVYTCQSCGQLVYFENSRCERCGSGLGFRTDTIALATLRPVIGGEFEPLDRDGPVFRRCANAESAGCNWLAEVDGGRLCLACAMGRRIPDLNVLGNLALWRAAESAKRRLVYALLRFGLPFETPSGARLVFDILSDAGEEKPVLTGHEDGLITINLAEADPAERERRRADLGEAYRTLLGHFRHEVGHFYWDAIVRDANRVEECRAVFGDERLDYAEALQRHYENGAPPGWQEAYVSAYATMHPWEDFAETWAHYLHLVDALETAQAFGLRVDPAVSRDLNLHTSPMGDPYRAATADRLIADWLPLSYAVNSMNRSLGQADLYPFVLSGPAIAKLEFVHDVIRAATAHQAQAVNRRRPALESPAADAAQHKDA